MLLKLSDAQSAQRTTEDATKCCKSRCALGWVESKTSRAELRHPQLNLIKSTHGVGLRFELGFFYEWNSKGTWEWGWGDEDAPTSQRDEIMNEHGPSPGAKRARAVARQCDETWAANANWWPGLRCDAHHSISETTSGQTSVSISHAHRNRISMIIIMSRKTGKPVKPRTLLNANKWTVKCFDIVSCIQWKHFQISLDMNDFVSHMVREGRGHQQASTLFLWRMVSYFKGCQRLSLFPIQSVLIFSSR